jgi:hypothetical protein
MRALKIMAEPGEPTQVVEVELNPDEVLTSLYQEIGCQTVTGAGYIGNDHCVWADDDAMFTAEEGSPLFQVSWIADTLASVLIGTLIVTGYKYSNGDTLPATMTVGQLHQLVHKVGEWVPE